MTPPVEHSSGYECAQAPSLSRLEDKLDRLTEAVSQIAVQNHRLTALEEYAEDHEVRIRNLESAPVKALSRFAWMLAGGIGTIGASVLIALIVAAIQKG